MFGEGGRKAAPGTRGVGTGSAHTAGGRAPGTPVAAQAAAPHTHRPTGRRDPTGGPGLTHLPIGARRVFLLVVFIKHPVRKCFLLVILFFKNH